jgi:hypothetical protein
MLDQPIAPEIHENEVGVKMPATTLNIHDIDGAVPPIKVPAAPRQKADDLSVALLKALTAMAVRSKRRQADLGAALRRAGLTAGREQILAALRDLEAAGCVEHLVPLSDGGLLLSVTTQGIERLGSSSRWDFMAPVGAA